MSNLSDQAVYNIRRFYRKIARPQKYRASYRVTDERSGQVMANGDLVGQAVFTTHTFWGENQQAREIKPNRKITPSRRIVTDPGGEIALPFD